MKIEKIPIENLSSIQETKEYKIECSEVQSIDDNRLASMLYYILNPSPEIKTSINSYRNTLSLLKTQEGSNWKNKIITILKSINCHDSSTHKLL